MVLSRCRYLPETLEPHISTHLFGQHTTTYLHFRNHYLLAAHDTGFARFLIIMFPYAIKQMFVLVGCIAFSCSLSILESISSKILPENVKSGRHFLPVVSTTVLTRCIFSADHSCILSWVLLCWNKTKPVFLLMYEVSVCWYLISALRRFFFQPTLEFVLYTSRRWNWCGEL
jgi:hypothetical protein